MELKYQLPLIWIAVMTLVAYVAMGYDKLQAVRGKRRVSEKTLFLLAIFGGSIGSVAGMYSFHHKTKHWYFYAGLPAILLAQIALAIAAWYILSR